MTTGIPPSSMPSNCTISIVLVVIAIFGGEGSVVMILQRVTYKTESIELEFLNQIQVIKLFDQAKEYLINQAVYEVTVIVISQ